jgi:hypothetical protein
MFEVTGFTANAEVLGSPREVHYDDGCLEIRGLSIGEARQAIDRLTTNAPPPVAVIVAPKPHVASEQAHAKVVKAPVHEKPAPIQLDTEEVVAAKAPIKSNGASNHVNGNGVLKATAGNPGGYSFEEACKVAPSWVGTVSQPVNYLFAHGITELPAVEAEILKLHEKQLLSFFPPDIEPTRIKERVKRVYTTLREEQ